MTNNGSSQGHNQQVQEQPLPYDLYTELLLSACFAGRKVAIEVIYDHKLESKDLPGHNVERVI